MPELSQPVDGASRATTESIVDDQDRPLDPHSVTVARLAAAIWLLILAVPLVILALILLLSSGGASATLILIGVGFASYVALFIWRLMWPGVAYRHTFYRLGERGLWIRRGVFWKTEISVPKSRVQHTDVSQGPLQRRFDIATLVLHTAGTQHAAVALGGLSYSVALAIRDYLIEGELDDAV